MWHNKCYRSNISGRAKFKDPTMRQCLFISSVIALAATLTSNQAQAALIQPTFNQKNCGAVTLTSVAAITAPGSNLLSNSYVSSQCIGFISTPPPKPITHNDDPHNNPTTNIGYFGDGLLNGGNPYFDGSEFIDVNTDYQDLKKKGSFVDPGWIHLTHFDADTKKWTYSNAGTGIINPTLNIADLLTFSIDCAPLDPDSLGNLGDCKSGTWQLKTKTDIIQQVVQLLGPATFDHLAFSIKAGPNFVVYDFDFKDIFGAENNPLLNFNTPYVLGGTFNTSDMRNAGISHMNVFARDPQDPNRIPAPATLLMFGLGLMFLSAKTQLARIIKR